MNILNKIKMIDFPQHQYVRERTLKKQIFLHHTVSPNNSAQGDINHWLSTTSRIATHFIITADGTPNQLFSSKYWAYHLGIKSKIYDELHLRYKKLDKYSIGIEIDSGGGLFKKGDGNWYDVYGHLIPNNQVVEYPEGNRGYTGFQKYTNTQLETLKELLIYFNEKCNIPLDYNEDMWDVCEDALSGKSGIWSHTSVRSDKSDCHPQPELIEMLKNLNK